MKMFHALSLAKKLYLLIAFFMLALVITGGVGIQAMRQASQAQSIMYANTVVPLRQVVDAGRQAAVHFRRMYPYILKDDPKSREETRNLNDKSEEGVLQAIEFLRKDAPTPELNAIGGKLADKWAEYKASVKRLYAAADSGSADGAMDELKAKTDPLHVEVRNLMLEAGKLQEARSKEDTERVAESVNQSARLIMLIIAIALFAGGGIGLAMVRFVTRQLGGDPGEAVRIASLVAQGNLANRVDLHPSDKASLLFQLETMRKDLSRVFQSVQSSAQLVSHASNEISSGTNDLSSRTERQASALEETAASMEELGSSAAQNAESSKTAQQLATQASTVAGEAGDMVAQVVQTMKGINESSSKIANIIGVIDSIAFQTNILALNAAVEAARAGEQGRGFAVVASEVRSLAHRSAEAAREIKTLINASTANVTEGATVVDKAGSTMNELVEAIRRVRDIVAEITASSSEQSMGVQEIGQAITQMDEATQQNAALVEQSAAAVESLKDQAQQLVHAISFFQIDQGSKQAQALGNSA
nr:methyl-accepting chemotaxis protein [uncultured Rhodoferax sp.]